MKENGPIELGVMARLGNVALAEDEAACRAVFLKAHLPYRGVVASKIVREPERPEGINDPF